MAEGDFVLHNKYKAEQAKANIDLVNDTFKVALLNGWTPNIDSDHYWSDISANEIVASGYTAGGVTLTTLAVTEDDANDRAAWDFADPVWASLATTTITRAAVYKWTGVTSASVIVGNIEIATNSNGQSYTLAVNAAGAMLIGA